MLHAVEAEDVTYDQCFINSLFQGSKIIVG